MDIITITHKITVSGVATTVEMPNRTPITKTWMSKDYGFQGDTTVWWDDEDLPEEIAEAADRAPTDVCQLLESD